MIALSTAFRAQHDAGTNNPVELYEIAFEGGATYYFAEEEITWNGNTYQPYVKSRSDIKRYMRGQFDQVTVSFSNVDTTMAQFVEANDPEGETLTIRVVYPTVTDDSLPIFVGPIQQLGDADDETIELKALERLGSIDMNAPTRLFGEMCGWLFKGDQCLYAGAAADCDHSWANCVALSNTQHFGGFRFMPMSGTYQYKQVTESRFLLFFSRKKTTTVTAAFGSVDDTPYDVPIPIALGRVQLQAIPIEHVDDGPETKSLEAFCVGEVDQFVFCLANNTLINIADDADLHFGAEGGVDSHQMVDPRFPNSYPYTLLAYIGLTLPSDVTAVDNAPDITAVIMGKVIDFFDASGAWSHFGWSDNAIWNTREFLALSYYEGGMGIPWGWIDDARNYAEAAYCDELVSDATNDQKIYLPDPMPAGMVAGANYRAYRSTCVDGYDPATDGPYSTYTPGVDDDSSHSPAPVNVRRFTLNVAIAQQQAAIDVLQSKLLPAFRGYCKQNKLGKIQICVEKANPRALVTTAAAGGVTHILCDTPASFAAGDLLILSTYTANAEVRKVDHTDGTGVWLTQATAFAHAIGDEILKVARAFDDSNVVSNTKIQYPLRDRQQPINRINVAYVDAPAGFVARTLYVNDYDHQAKVHKINDQDLDGSGIDSYFQAWRIGEFNRAMYREMGKFVALRAGIQSMDLEVGDDVIAVSAPEHGLQCVPFRVIELGFTADDETDVVGQLYSSDVYNDEAPQSTRTVPSIFAAASNPLLDTDVPPAPVCDIASVGSGLVTFTPITFATLVNTVGVNSAIIVLLYSDENLPDTALLTTALSGTAASGDPDTVHTDTDLTGIVKNGDWLLIGGEMLFVTADATSADVAVKRALGLTAAEAHAIGAPVKRLSTAVFSYPFPTGFFSSDNAAGWGPSETLPDAAIALFNIVCFNARGESLASPINYSQSVGGLRHTGDLSDGVISRG